MASLFVNPSQFAPQEDFLAYPRDEAADAHRLATAGCDLLYAPETNEMYPAGFSTTVTADGLSPNRWRASSRPHHFAGVATVVAKLLIRAAPDVAIFGEKDYQQLQVIRRMVLDLDLPVEIIGAPIVRDADGLALSSRNVYLTADKRAVAPALHEALREAVDALRGGAGVALVERTAIRRIEAAGFERPDYVEVRAPDDLRRLGPGPLEPGRLTQRARILAAARLGATRLIDNLTV